MCCIKWPLSDPWWVSWDADGHTYHNHYKTKYQDHHREDLWYWRLVQKAEPKAEHFSTSRTSSHARLGRWEDGDCSRTEPLVETRLGALAFKFMCSCPCQEVCQFALVEGPFGLPEHPAHIPPRVGGKGKRWLGRRSQLTPVAFGSPPPPRHPIPPPWLVRISGTNWEALAPQGGRHRPTLFPTLAHVLFCALSDLNILPCLPPVRVCGWG